MAAVVVAVLAVQAAGQEKKSKGCSESSLALNIFK